MIRKYMNKFKNEILFSNIFRKDTSRNCICKYLTNILYTF